MNEFLSGAIFMGYVVCVMFFLRAFRQTGDRLFAHFGAAFTILALERLVLVAFQHDPETRPVIYLARLLAFVTITGAILAKNRGR